LRVASAELCFVGLAALGLAMGAGIRKPSACGRPAQVAWPMLEAVDVCGAGSRAYNVLVTCSLYARYMPRYMPRYMLVTCRVRPRYMSR
jgi:hypothetical protein